MNSYSNKLVINASPQKLYEAISAEEGLKSWWTNKVEIKEDTIIFGFDNDVYATMRVIETIPNRKILWECIAQHFPTEGTDKTDEWIGTKVSFDIKANNDGVSTLTFTHEGLTPELFCYKECNNGWNYFMHSLKQYLETGNGTPYSEKKH